MELLLRHEFRDIKIHGNSFYITNFFEKLRLRLIERYPNISFKPHLDNNMSKYGQGGTYSCMSFSIVNPSNGNYILISFFDNWKYHFMTHMGWEPKKMKQFFYPGGFNFLDYFTFKKHSEKNNDVEFPSNIEQIYSQFYYQPYFDCCYDYMTELYNNRDNSNKIRNLFFRGWIWDFRKKMINGIQQNDIKIIDKNNGDNNLDYPNYLKELSKYSCSLSLPGGNEMCNRDIESFAIGVPVIRPHLQINYKDPLIPNYHYINCYHACDYSIDGNAKFISYDDFSKNLVHVWNSIKNNDEYLNFISKNARDWFLNNCTLEKNLDYLLSKIDITLLK